VFILDEKIFTGGFKLCGLPLKWFRSVSAFLNSLCGENGVKVKKPTSPTVENPVVLSIDEEWLDQYLAEKDIETSAPVSTVETDENGVEGIARATAAYVTGDGIAQAAGRVDPKSSGTWAAGTGKALTRYEVSSIAPFYVATTRYAKVFVRKNTYSPSGGLVSQGPEVDQGIVVMLIGV